MHGVVPRDDYTAVYRVKNLKTVTGSRFRVARNAAQKLHVHQQLGKETKVIFVFKVPLPDIFILIEDLLWCPFHLRVAYVFQFYPIMSLPVKLLQHMQVFVDLSWLIMTTLSIVIPHIPRHLPVVSIFVIV